MDTKEYQFTVEKDGQVVIKNIVNKVVKGQLKIIKVDDVDKKPLANVKFEIYNENKDLVDTIVTDQNGEAISKVLPHGKYTYKETEVPEEIVLDSTEYSFEITKADQVIVKNIVNTKIKGNLLILKINEKTREPIAGVTFQILDSNKNVIETLTTDANGRLKSSTLLKGTYFYKEISAPEKYIVESKEQKFEIKTNGVEVYKTVTNKEKELPTTGGFGTNNSIVLMVSLFSILGYIVFRKKEENC